MPRQAQRNSMPTRKAEARAEPESSLAQRQTSPREPQAVQRNGKALAEPPSETVSTGRAVPNGHSQANVVCLVGAPNRVEERIERFLESPGKESVVAEAVQDLAQHVWVATPCR